MMITLFDFGMQETQVQKDYDLKVIQDLLVNVNLVQLLLICLQVHAMMQRKIYLSGMSDVKDHCSN